jgi:hypothetical protein
MTNRALPRSLLVASLLALLAVSACIRPPPQTPPGQPANETGAPRPPGPGLDAFGIRMLYPSAAGGMAWASSWASRARRFDGVDPDDPWFDAAHGDASYIVSGDGILQITGSVPRMYVHDPALERQWGNVEITMYFKRLADGSVPWGGMVSVARTNHGTTGNENVHKCDTRGVGARMRYDGAIDFEKETNHPESHAVARQMQWSDGLPLGIWIGYKHVVVDLPDGRVRQELWIDERGGEGGGEWRLLNSFEDDGQSFGAAAKACDATTPSTLPLSRAAARAGSESGKPNISVYFRSDDVGPNGLWYKWGSVREIEADARTPPPP